MEFTSNKRDSVLKKVTWNRVRASIVDMEKQ